MNTHMGSIHGKIISSSGSWKDNASSSSSLCAAHDKIEIDCDIYCDVCDSISQVRDGLGSHMRAMHVKKHNQFCRKEWFLGIMFWRKESATLVQEKWWVDLLWNFMKLIDLLVTNVTTSLNCSHLLEDTNVLDIKEKTRCGHSTTRRQQAIQAWGSQAFLWSMWALVSFSRNSHEPQRIFTRSIQVFLWWLWSWSNPYGTLG